MVALLGGGGVNWTVESRQRGKEKRGEEEEEEHGDKAKGVKQKKKN